MALQYVFTTTVSNRAYPIQICFLSCYLVIWQGGLSWKRNTSESYTNIR